MEGRIFMYAGWIKGDPLIGFFDVARVRGRESSSFEYDRSWLSEHPALLLDPYIESYPGHQFPKVGNNWFGALSDAAPDRWGRQLMDRWEIITARKEDRSIRKLTESDYLLGVHDEGRVGAFRFKTDPEGAFLSDESALAAPPMTELRKLEHASLSYENSTDYYEEKWIRDLINPGSSLGGARPKANVMDADGSMWIAKFPSRNDIVNIGAWEMVAHDLAILCGIQVPEAKTIRFSDRGDTFLVKRFDRIPENGALKRMHFASAMTMLGETDGSDNPISYLNIAEIIEEIGAAPEEDLRQLWQRIVFSIAISNSDDHLRNHGFLLFPDGWHLSPAYDMNPTYDSSALSLNINLDDNTKEMDLALEIAGFFRWEEEAASAYISDVSYKVSRQWRYLADKYHIPRTEQNLMCQAFC